VSGNQGVVIDVPMNGPSYLPGARLLAVLADPPIRAGQMGWRQTERALCRLYLAAKHGLDERWAETPQLVVPNHLTMSLAEAEKRAAKARKRHDERMGAAHVMVPFLRAAQQGSFDSDRTRRLTADQEITRTIHQEADRREALVKQGVVEPPRFSESIDNFEVRVLRASLPVIHLAVAIGIAIDRSQKILSGRSETEQAKWQHDLGGRQIGFADIMMHPEYVAWIIREAEALEPLLPLLPKLKPKPESIVRLRVVGA
jgi:hypothetical protein